MRADDTSSSIEGAIVFDPRNPPEWLRPPPPPHIRRPAIILGSLTPDDCKMIEKLTEAILRSEIAKRTFYRLLDENKEHRWEPEFYEEEIVEEFRTRTEQEPLASLEIPVAALTRFQSSSDSSTQEVKDLGLLDVLVEVIHALAVRFHRMDKHSRTVDDGSSRREPFPYLAHDEYNQYRGLPNKVNDSAAFWAEVQIFGGVVQFDRGPSGDECLSAFVHPQRKRDENQRYGPSLLYAVEPAAIREFVVSLEKDELSDAKEALLRFNHDEETGIELHDIPRLNITRWKDFGIMDAWRTHPPPKFVTDGMLNAGKGCVLTPFEAGLVDEHGNILFKRSGLDEEGNPLPFKKDDEATQSAEKKKVEKGVQEQLPQNEEPGKNRDKTR